MIRIFIYLCPFLINYIQGGTAFIAAHNFSVAQAPAILVTGTMTAWAAAYMLFSLLIGRLTTKENCHLWISGAALGLSLIAACYLVFDGLYIQFLWVTLTGAAGAVYCTPFQVFMKTIEPDQNVGTVRATSLYTVSWSLGNGTGPFIFGLFPTQTGFCLNYLFGIFIAAGILLLKKSGAACPQPVEKKKASGVDYTKSPNLVLSGWIWGGIGGFTIAILRTLLPYQAEVLAFSKANSGLILATVSYIQALTAFLLIVSKKWMYHVLPILFSGLFGVVSLILFSFMKPVWCFYLGACLYAIYSGVFFFYFVFHSLVHPTKSTHYVAMNEAIVGFTSVISPLIGGLLVFNKNVMPAFMSCAALIIFAVLIVAVLNKRARSE